MMLRLCTGKEVVAVVAASMKARILRFQLLLLPRKRVFRAFSSCCFSESAFFALSALAAPPKARFPRSQLTSHPDASPKAPFPRSQLTSPPAAPPKAPFSRFQLLLLPRKRVFRAFSSSPISSVPELSPPHPLRRSILGPLNLKPLNQKQAPLTGCLSSFKALFRATYQ
jgi:hypothetical protein